MGIYLFNTDVLLPELMKDAEDPDSKHDFGHNILPKLLGRYKMHGLQLRRREQAERPLLARCRHARGLLRGQHGRRRRLPHLQPLRQVLAHAHAALPVPARQVRLRRARTYRHGHQLHRLRRLASSPAPSSATPCCRRMSASTPTPTSTRRIIFSHVNIGRHCRIRHAIIDRDVHIPDGTVIGYDPNEDKKNYFVSERPHRRHPRLLRLRKPRQPRFLQQGGSW